MADPTQSPALQPSTKMQLLAQALREMGILPQQGAAPPPAAVAPPVTPPLGTGIAAQGAGLLQNRGNQLDAQIKAAGG